MDLVTMLKTRSQERRGSMAKMQTKIVVKAYNIDWDLDGDDDAPAPAKEIVMDMDLADIEDAIHNGEDVNAVITDALSEYLSDREGFCHNGFEWCFV
jgi:hypothetical protein